MGAMGSDAAIEAADVVLMDDDPLKIVKAIRISKKCLGIVYQNIVFALGSKGRVPDSRSTWDCKYVARNLCRCGSYGTCNTQCDAYTFCEEVIKRKG